MENKNKKIKQLSSQQQASYEKQLCNTCIAKINEFHANLKKRDWLRPKKTARKFASLLCSNCNKRMRKQVIKNENL